MYCWKVVTPLFSASITGWLVVLCNLVLEAHAQDQHVNTQILLASPVTKSSAFGIKGKLAATDLLTTYFIGMATLVAVLQNYTILRDFGISISY